LLSPAELDASPAPLLWRERCVEEIEAMRQRPLHRKTRRCLDYFASIIPADRLPGRPHFDPMRIPDLLPNIWLVDVIRGDALRFRYRLIGTRAAKTFPKDVTHRFLEEVHEDFAANPMRRYLEEIVDRRIPSWRRGSPNAWLAGQLIDLERLYLPLARDGVSVDMIVGFTLFTLDGREI
jgi:hypothetical protein